MDIGQSWWSHWSLYTIVWDRLAKYGHWSVMMKPFVPIYHCVRSSGYIWTLVSHDEAIRLYIPLCEIVWLDMDTGQSWWSHSSLYIIVWDRLAKYGHWSVMMKPFVPIHHCVRSSGYIWTLVSHDEAIRPYIPLCEIVWLHIDICQSWGSHSSLYTTVWDRLAKYGHWSVLMKPFVSICHCLRSPG